jgi:hypothetical protein
MQKEFSTTLSRNFEKVSPNLEKLGNPKFLLENEND